MINLGNAERYRFINATKLYRVLLIFMCMHYIFFWIYYYAQVYLYICDISIPSFEETRAYFTLNFNFDSTLTEFFLLIFKIV